MNIKYENYSGQPIISEQIENLEEYRKLYYENDELKKSETYMYNMVSDRIELYSGSYFVSMNEDLESVISDLLNDTDKWWIYFNCQSNRLEDKLWDYRVYVKAQLDHKGRIVFDMHQRVISECVIAKETNIEYSKRKYFYGDPAIFEVPFKDAPALTFNYNSLTNLPMDVALDFGIYMDGNYNISQFTQDANIMAIFPWQQYPWLHNYEPMLP